MAVILSQAGCGTSGESPSVDGGSPAAAPEPAVCPLTATPAPSGLDLQRPALSVKIENAANARPQTGLGEADIVYEQLAEGGITRFNAIYHCSDADDLGPVRSARFVDPDILLEYRPVLFAYAGAAPPVQDKIQATEGITDLSHGRHGDAYRRDRSRKAPHNLFSSGEKLRSLADAEDVRGVPDTGFQFEKSEETTPDRPEGTSQPGPAATSSTATPAAPGSEVSFSFGGRSPSRYTYDAGSGRYLRFHGTEPHRASDGTQITVTNVVVFKVQVKPGSIRDAAGNFSPEIAVVGGGEATVLSGGKSVAGRWNRPSLSDKTTLTGPAGGAIKLKPGNTWVHLVPVTQPVSLK